MIEQEPLSTKGHRSVEKRESQVVYSLLQCNTGSSVEVLDDGLRIEGGGALKAGAECNSYGDHRIAMSFAIASLLADGHMTILDKNCVDISFPTFYQDLNRLAGNTLHF